MKKAFLATCLAAAALWAEPAVKIKRVEYDVKTATVKWKVEVGDWDYQSGKFKVQQRKTLYLDLHKGTVSDGKKPFPFHEVERILWHDRLDAVARYLVESTFWYVDPKVREEYYKEFERLERRFKEEKYTTPL